MTMEGGREHDVHMIHIKAGEGTHDALIRSIRQNVIASTGIVYRLWDGAGLGYHHVGQISRNLRKTDSDLCIYIQREQGSSW